MCPNIHVPDPTAAEVQANINGIPNSLSDQTPALRQRIPAG
jgi:hypothetical protein